MPISMVAMRKETIEDMGATSIEDLTVMVPNVFVRENPSVDNFNIRGIAGGARNPGMAANEGVFLDGIVMGTSPANSAGKEVPMVPVGF